MNSKTEKGLNALQIASTLGHLECVQFLFKSGVSWEANEEEKGSKSAIQWARKQGKKEVVTWLRVPFHFLFLSILLHEKQFLRSSSPNPFSTIYSHQ